MLSQLNQILSQKHQSGCFDVCFDLSSNKTISSDKFRQDLARLSNKISLNSASKWLLSIESSYWFLVALFALLTQKKEVIICANRTPRWLDEINSEYDAIISESDLDIDNKLSINLDCGTESFNESQYQLSGAEVITFFTSGSTGAPKAIKKKLISLLNEVETLEEAFGLLVQNKTVVASVSHSHIYGLLFKLLWPFVTGRSWAEQQIEYPEQLLMAKRSERPFVFVSSPAFLSRIDLDLNGIEPTVTFSSGGPLSLAAAQLAKNYFKNVPIEIYGSTETGGIAHRQQTELTTPWKPFKKVVLEINNTDTILRSPHIAEKYGIVLDDQLEIFSDGQFILKGRKDRVVKLEEKRVSLTEIESYLETMTSVENSVALLLSGERHVLGVVIVLSSEGQLLLEEKGKRYLVEHWKRQMRQRFEPVTIPRKWRIVECIPLTSQSKLDTDSLLQLFCHSEKAS